MNPLTLVKRIQSLNSKEAALGISEDASWHAKYRDSAYVFAGGIPYDLTEGDLLAVFAQYGEVVDVNLVRDKGTGKPKGFAFIAYEDQRSTNLAVDNLNGAQVLGRIIRVDHVSKYKKKEEEDEETEQKKREERGMCRAFQRGECSRGAGCKFSHDEQRAANTGWGPKDDRSARWGHDKFEVPRTKGNEGLESNHKRSQSSSRDQDVRGRDKRPEFREREVNYEEDGGKQSNARSSRKHDYEIQSTEALDRREEKRSKRQDSEYNHRGDRDLDVYRRGDPKYKGGEKKLVHGSDSSIRHHRGAVDYRDSEFYWSEDQRNQGGEKRSMYERDSSSHQCRGTDEGRDRQFYPWGDRNNHGGKKRSVHERDSTSHHHGETDEDY